MHVRLRVARMRLFTVLVHSPCHARQHCIILVLLTQPTPPTWCTCVMM